MKGFQKSVLVCNLFNKQQLSGAKIDAPSFYETNNVCSRISPYYGNKSNIIIGYYI